MKKLRIASQVAFLVLFFILLIKTDYSGENQIPYPVKLFLDFDPLALLAVLLPAWNIPEGMPLILFGSLGLVALTALIGRFFCGWVCPLGSLNHLFGTWGERRKVRVNLQSPSVSLPARERGLKQTRPWGQQGKYYLLIGLLVAACFSVQLLGFLDPLSLLIRSMSVSILPGINYCLHSFFSVLYEGFGGNLRGFSEPVYAFLKERFLSFNQPYFRQSLILGLIFFCVLGLNWIRPRFWCQVLCPLGALLGLVSRFSFLSLKANKKCTQCGQCLPDCQGGADPHQEWRREECLWCWNCHRQCPQEAIRVGFSLPWGRKIRGVDLERRYLLTAAASGLILPLLVRTAAVAKVPQPQLIRPPGALAEGEFLRRCIRCGECMKVCLTNGLHPTLLEAGLEGLWTPILVSKLGYCEYFCTLCGQVCPTGAIQELKEEVKVKTRIGLAFIDQGRCLPFAFGIPCIVCEEHCPTPKKAIIFETKTVAPASSRLILRQDAGATIVGQGIPPKEIKLPQVDPNLCIGCGICEYKCPVTDWAAIRVTSIGESRSRENQLTLGLQ